jgi:hypothetical protein
MSAAHSFQTPHVEPLVARRDEPSGTVLLRVAPADAERIVRALNETSLNLASGPGGAHCATAYRRLASDLRAQASRAA